MEWKKIKLMLIVLFLFINIFLIHMIYNKNIKNYVDTINAIEAVFNTHNVTIIPNLNALEQNKRLSKLYVSNIENLNDNLLITMEEALNYETIGRKKQVVDIVELLSNFLRDIAPKDLLIKNIYLGYYFNSSQLNEEVISGEAEPCWVIETNIDTYLYNAYNGELIL